MYYLALRPQTAVSMLFTGKLPETLPDWYFPKNLVLYTDFNEAINNSHANRIDEIFLVELLYTPKPLASEDIVATGKISLTPEGEERLEVTELKLATIRRILVNSFKGAKLLQRLLNSDCLFTIEIRPEYFAKFIPPAKLVSVDPEVSSKSVLLPSPSKLDYVMRTGDLLGSKAQTLVNTVNCVGVMGKGIAFSFKHNYPDMFADYKARCDRNEVKLGVPYLYKVSKTRWIINFPTKDHWKNNSTLKSIEDGLKYLAAHLVEWGVTSLAIPPLGCGNGNLNWSDVSPLIERYLKPLGLLIEVYEPFEGSKAATYPAAKRPRSSMFPAASVMTSSECEEGSYPETSYRGRR